MFENVGEKIKTFAKVVCGIGIALSAIAAIAVMVATEFWDFGFEYLLLTLFVGGMGFLFSWLSSLFVYGFGGIISKLNRIEYNTRPHESVPEMNFSTPSMPVETTWTCTKCGGSNPLIARFCKDCGSSK